MFLRNAYPLSNPDSKVNKDSCFWENSASFSYSRSFFFSPSQVNVHIFWRVEFSNQSLSSLQSYISITSTRFGWSLPCFRCCRYKNVFWVQNRPHCWRNVSVCYAILSLLVEFNYFSHTKVAMTMVVHLVIYHYHSFKISYHFEKTPPQSAIQKLDWLNEQTTLGVYWCIFCKLFEV